MNALCMSLMILSTALAGSGNPAGDLPGYDVQEVISVRSMSEFECRLADHPYSKNARFRVKINAVTPVPGISAEQSRNYVAHRLKKSGKIRLKNAQIRNYFRLSADVIVDGADLGRELIDNQLATESIKTGPVGMTEQPIRRQSPLISHQTSNTHRQPGDPNRRLARYSQTRKVISLDDLLATKINMSMINENTTFEEALGILSDSVQPPLPLVVLWADLEQNAMIDRDTPIGLGGYGNIQLKQLLKLMLRSVSVSGGLKPELAYEGNVVTIGTQRGLLQKSANHVYSVKDLTAYGYDEYGMPTRNGQDLSRILQGDSAHR